MSRSSDLARLLKVFKLIATGTKLITKGATRGTILDELDLTDVKFQLCIDRIRAYGIEVRFKDKVYSVDITVRDFELILIKDALEGRSIGHLYASEGTLKSSQFKKALCQFQNRSLSTSSTHPIGWAEQASLGEEAN